MKKILITLILCIAAMNSSQAAAAYSEDDVKNLATLMEATVMNRVKDAIAALDKVATMAALPDNNAKWNALWALTSSFPLLDINTAAASGAPKIRTNAIKNAIAAAIASPNNGGAIPGTYTLDPASAARQALIVAGKIS